MRARTVRSIDAARITRAHCSVLLLGLCLASILPAQAAWYQVEVIVFEYLDPDPGDETWYENPGLPAIGEAMDLLVDPPDPLPPIPIELEPEIVTPAPVMPKPVAPPPEPKVKTADDPVTLADRFGAPDAGESEPASLLETIRIPYYSLAPEDLRLTDVHRSLRTSRDYRPLLHVAWQQEENERGPGRTVHLEKPWGPEIAPLVTMAAPDAPPVMTRMLDGTVRVSIGRFMYVDVDLAYQPENLPGLLASRAGSQVPSGDPLVNPETEFVRLTETRQIKLEELHYFDHPLFGVLVQVSRLPVLVNPEVPEKTP
ncbi:MAG: hypothetical protein EPO31_00975 [Gammaproteobacteria bacterium]|nr:MAG: hypothetical protein EPO31_00975 [Gammaproteobacteria bacterium]